MGNEVLGVGHRSDAPGKLIVACRRDAAMFVRQRHGVTVVAADCSPFESNAREYASWGATASTETMPESQTGHAWLAINARLADTSGLAAQHGAAGTIELGLRG